MNKILFDLTLGLATLTSFAKPYEDYSAAQLADVAGDLLKKNNKIENAGVWISADEKLQAKQLLRAVNELIAAGSNELEALAQQLEHFIDATAFSPTK